jgi:uncharacterized membrane protein YphA (DoxX/SURF4 family)
MKSLSFFVVALIPSVAFAHTRWFAHEALPRFSTTEPTALYLSVWAVIVATIIAFGIWLERRRFLQLDFLKPKAGHAFERAASTFSMVVGSFLMIAGTHEYLFSPNLSHEAGVSMLLIMFQFVLGLSFLLGIFARVSALILGALWLLSVFVIGLEPMLENIWVLSSAAFIFFMGNDYFSIVKARALAHLAKPYHAYALPALRLGTGATLLVLGFTEKIFRPEFGINFLNLHDWNFMQTLGFSHYSDYLFTLSAGSVEALLGLIFILGIVTRLNALVVAIFFTTPLFFLGPIELAGHVPHFAAVILLLIFGAGEHWKLVHKRKVR